LHFPYVRANIFFVNSGSIGTGLGPKEVSLVPNIKSAKKRVEISRKRAAKNAAARSTIKTTIKKFNAAIAADSTPEQIQSGFTKAVSLLDRAAQKGLIHRNAVARKKSKLAKKLNASLGQKAETNEA